MLVMSSVALRRPAAAVQRSLCICNVASSSGDSPEIETATSDSLLSVSEFFVDAFWLAGTTCTELLTLSARERRQLVGQMAIDFDSRYGNSWASPALPPAVFPSRLHIARYDGDTGIVGCVGVEAALLNPFTRQIFTRAQSEALIRVELDLLSGSEYEELQSLYTSNGASSLVNALYPELQLLGLLTNLAVAPLHRRCGLAHRLCGCCEEDCRQWGLPAVLLQVEQTNHAAFGLYSSLGYDQLWLEDGVASVRLAPGTGTFSSSLLLAENNDLLTSEPSTVLTMAKGLEE